MTASSDTETGADPAAHADAAVARTARAPSRRRRSGSVLVLLLVLLVVVAVASTMLGRYALSPRDIAALVAHPDAPQNAQAAQIFFDVRLVRIQGAAAVGGALALAGALLQAVLRNPMVSPDVLGASGGAGFGASVGLLLGLGTLPTQALSFTGGLAAVLLALMVARLVGGDGRGVLTLILTGMVVSSLCAALISLVKYIGDPADKLPQITFWLLGGLSSIRRVDVIALLIVLALASLPLIVLRWRLNVLAFGDEQAATMGVNVMALRVCAIGTATLLTAVAVSVAGIVGWVGLIVPHLARIVVGADTRYALVASTLLGAAFLLIVDTTARSAAGLEIPLGVLTAVLGAPVFLYLLVLGRRRSWL